MKKIKKIFSIALPLLLLNVNSYAVETITENLTGSVKYVGIAIAVAIIGLIIFLGYKSDKRVQEKPVKKVDNNYNNFDNYQAVEENPIDDFSKDEITFEDTNLIEEEESLYNSVNDYVEERKNDEISMLENIDEESELDIEESPILEEIDEEIELDIEEENEDKLEVEMELENKEEIKEETYGFTFDTASEYNEETEPVFESIEEIKPEEETLDFEYENEENNEHEFDFGYETVEEKEQIENNFEEAELNLESTIEEVQEQTVENKVKKYTGKKLDKKASLGIIQDMGLDFEEIIYDDEDDEDIGVPTFDELLKQSEQDEDFTVTEEFDFMSQMEENLKKNKESKIAKKSTAKKQATKKDTTKKSGTTKKSTTTKKTTTKKKKTE